MCQDSSHLYESPRKVELEVEDLTNKAVQILKDYDVEATEEIMESFDNLRMQKMAKANFFEELMRTLAMHIKAHARANIESMSHNNEQEDDVYSLQQLLSNKVLSQMASEKSACEDIVSDSDTKLVKMRSANWNSDLYMHTRKATAESKIREMRASELFSQPEENQVN